MVENKYHIKYIASYIKDYKTKHISSNSSTKVLSSTTLQKLIANIEVSITWMKMQEIVEIQLKYCVSVTGDTKQGDEKSMRRKITKILVVAD